MSAPRILLAAGGTGGHMFPAEALAHALQYARDMGKALADKFVGMYVNHWTLAYGERGREAVRLFLDRGVEAGVIPHQVQVEFAD